MQKKTCSLIISAAFCLALTGCAARSSSSRTTNPPPGPIQADTTEPGVIPSGTSLVLRTNAEIRTEQAGQSYTAQVAQDIVDRSGNVLVPKGSDAELAVVQASSGGTVGTPNLELGVRSVKVRGRSYPISTGIIEERGKEGLGANRRTAEMTGGGALLGTLIGAVVGGGKGAAAGAAIGAAGGATAQVLTRGKEVRIPAESVLTFRLEQPWRLEGFRASD